MKRQIAIVRHGSVAAEYHRRYIGSTNVPIDAVGMKQAQAVGSFLHAGDFASCICSPMARTLKTAKIISKETAVPLSTEVLLREVDFGEWEGLNFDEVSNRFPDEVKQWLALGDDFVFPGGESIRGFHSRVTVAVERLLKSKERNQIVVTHGGVFRVMLCIFLGIPVKHVNAFSVMYGTTALVEFHDDKSTSGQLVFLRDCEVSNG